MGGLITSTLLTLLVLPAIYVMVARRTPAALAAHDVRADDAA